MTTVGSRTADTPDIAPARSWLRFTVPLLLAAALVWGAVRVADQLGDALHSVAAADVVRLLIASAFEAVCYLLLGFVLRRLADDPRLSRADAIRVGLVSVGLGNVLPAAPVEGMVMAAHELEGRGVPRRRTFVSVGLAQWYFARALFAVGAVAAFVVATFGALHASMFGDGWPWLLGAGFALAAVFVVMGMLAVRTHVLARVASASARIPLCGRRAGHLAASCRAWSAEVRDALGSRRNRVRLLVLAVGAGAADGSCFVFALRSAGVRAGWGALVLAYAVAMIGTLVPLMPAGIGVVETAVPAFLHHAGVPLAAALGGVLAYRAVATITPAIVGAGALGQLRLRRRRSRLRRQCTSGRANTSPRPERASD